MPSAVIEDFHYDPAAQMLTVRFRTGRIYRYFAVPPETFALFSAARSRGRYFNRHIRDRYRFREVTSAEMRASARLCHAPRRL